ncbi:MAG: cyclophilin-like fold protein [Spirochaetales bacterium]|nr:cyclophilin-like fold protein [Spirochaetales bacterium]
MNVKLTNSKGREVIIQMDDNATSRDFISQLPATLDFSDYARTEKVADPVSRLTTEGAPSGYKPSAGDLTLYAPWGNLALFYKGFSYSNGLVYMGRVISGEITDLEGQVKVEVEK